MKKFGSIEHFTPRHAQSEPPSQSESEWQLCGIARVKRPSEPASACPGTWILNIPDVGRRLFSHASSDTTNKTTNTQRAIINKQRIVHLIGAAVQVDVLASNARSSPERLAWTFLRSPSEERCLPSHIGCQTPHRAREPQVRRRLKPGSSAADGLFHISHETPQHPTGRPCLMWRSRARSL